jgi:adenylosuccinate lyase
LIERYSLPEMLELWSEQKKLETWLEVELAIVGALADLKIVPKAAAARIGKKARFDVGRVKELERVTKHDVLSFVECVGEGLGPDSRYFHMGITSSDVLDTALAILMREAARLVLAELEKVSRALRRLAAEHKDTLTIGRTHGIHAEPTTAGMKFAMWYNDVRRAIGRIETARDEACVGKVSGAVGTYSHLPPQVEDRALAALGLEPERPATQIVQRDRHAYFVSALALAAAVMEKIGLDLRSLQRTEIAEIEEPFTAGQKGSSSMPHKRNPITLERICGLARLVRANAGASLENIALWHERDISHSSVERVIIPDSTTAVHYMARCLERILSGLVVDVARMRSNIDLTRGRIYSQRLMLALMEAGWERTHAYEKVQGLTHTAACGDTDLKEATREDPEVMTVLSDDKLEGIFDPGFYIRHTHRILRGMGIIKGDRGCR